MAKKAELVFVPTPGMGHLVSTIQVAKLLVDLNSNLSITVLVLKPPSSSPTIIAKFDSLIARHVSDRIKFINLPQLEVDKDANPAKTMMTFLQAQRPHIKEVVNNIVRDSSSVPGSPQLVGFVLDMFFTSLIDLANEFGVPSYVFYTSGAAFLGFHLHVQALQDEQNINISELKDLDMEFNIPCYANPVPTKVFPGVVLKPESFNMKAELVFVPMPGLGHLVSTLELAKLLVDLNFNLSFTVLVIKSPSDQPTIAKIDSFIASTNSDRIKFINLPQGEIDKDAPPGKFMTAIIQSQRPQIKAAVKSIVRDSSSVPGSPQLAGFVFDMFLTSLTDLANEFGVPSYVFYTSGAAFLGFQLFIQAEANDNFNMTEFKDSDTEISVPTYVHSVPIKVFPSVMLKPETFDMVKRSTRELKEVKGIMVNTFSKLESHAIDSLSDSKLPCIYPVGPILNLKSPSEADQNSSLDIMEWLDQQPPSSVVFLCFGSMGSFGKDQVKEIAYALEHSGQRFLWSLRKPPADKRLIMVALQLLIQHKALYSGVAAQHSSHVIWRNKLWETSMTKDISGLISFKIRTNPILPTGRRAETPIIFLMEDTLRRIDPGVFNFFAAANDVRERLLPHP
ncbi:UDP-glucuronosyl/UDP-glucosyltransferase [Corchorus olitorius]|uniref:UDP-glucuronosyl/UDP-glucosyltransferase n=1 Tax=Corchorus olitorius TaxID=93759 RepID=A0A1R3J2H3_9ROSI|nr:UDP-glucuronosyl/UDP-glucosyltransferase [Corchorus olitorius]